MRTTAFAASLPLPGHTSRHENTSLSHTRIRPVCVAKPPPQKPGSQPSSNSMKASKRKRKSKGQYEGSRSAESLTAAQISEKISQAVGISLILEDVAHLTRFFRSLTKSKTSAPVDQELQREVEPDSNSETRLAVMGDSPYEPRSVTARRIATSYVKTRGAVDRALQAVSIRAQSYSKAVARVAGDAVCAILAVGHEAFPGLRLDKAKDAVASGLKGGWTPLSVFQWQLSSGDSEEIEARRKQRIQQVSGLLRGAGVDSFLTTVGSALTGVGRTVERLAPIAFQGVTKASFGYVHRKQSQKPHRRSLDSAIPSPSQRKRLAEHKEAISQDGVSKHRPFTSTSNQIELLQNALATTQEAVHSQPKAANRNVNARTATPRSDTGTHHVEKESTLDVEPVVSTTSNTGAGGVSASETASKQGAGLARTGAIVLATGAVAAATMTMSIPTGITFSALIVTSMALSGAKAANAVEHQAYGRLSPQSRSLQSLEGAFTTLSTASTKQPKKLSVLDIPTEENIRAQKGTVSKRATDSFEAGTKFTGNTDSRTIETSAYTVSTPRPSILSTPIIGVLLSCLDSVAFQMERLIETLLRRSSLKYYDFRSKGEWELLRSFQRSFKPD